MGDKEEGRLKIKTFSEFAGGVNHFKSLFQELPRSNIAEILKGDSLFPRLIDAQQNEDLDAEVTKGKLKSVLHSFKKAKGLGSDGWTT
jgi:hypothetical protein